MSTAAVGRCPWAESSAEMLAYHDQEWGVPEHDDRRLFELLVLEGAQAGLSWSTVLRKREHYRRAFDGFEPERVAAFDEARVAGLLGDAGIVRNRLKIASAVTNAKLVVSLAEQHGSFDAFLWGAAGGRVVNHPESMAELSATSALSDRLSKDLKRLGFSFVGSTIVYSYLQAVGIVDDHLASCPSKRP